MPAIDPTLIPSDLADYYRQAQTRLGPGRYQAHMYGREHQERRFQAVLDVARELKLARQARTCLEIGCCEGKMTAELAGLFERVTAVDFVPELLEVCPDLPNVTYRVLDIETVKPSAIRLFPRCAVGVMSEVIEHLRDPYLALYKALHWCDALIITTPINETPNSAAFALDRLGCEVTPGEASGHVWAWTFDEFCDLMRAFDPWHLRQVDHVTALAVLRGAYA